MIIIEGPDGSGKSTLARDLAEKSGMEIHHFGPPPKTQRELSERLKKSADLMTRPVIQDRTPWISEPIYGYLMRGENPFITWSDSLCFLLQKDVKIIYCRPPNFVILNSEHHNIKAYDTSEHVAQVTENVDALISLYDRFMLELNPMCQYDWTLESHHLAFGAFATLCQRMVS